jgi:hypothetical protein
MTMNFRFLRDEVYSRASGVFLLALAAIAVRFRSLGLSRRLTPVSIESKTTLPAIHTAAIYPPFP